MNLSKIVGFFPPVLAINVMHLLLHNYPSCTDLFGFSLPYSPSLEMKVSSLNVEGQIHKP